ncbi:MAG: tetratricopeptide repeat protein [Bryobacterales bacterium]|nr:tetratricopeptide repeat protein [Bryobacterales bacterium]
MDRQTRKQLKSDKFAEEVFDIFEWTTEHKSEVLRYGAIVLALVVIGLGWLMYSRHQAEVRQVELAKALRIDDASFGPNDQGGRLHFDTEEAKNKAREQSFADIAARFGGTLEGAVAEMYLAGWAVDKGDLAGAEKRFKRIVDDAPKEYAAMAKMALAQVYASENKPADGEKLLRELIASPTATVSKEQATIVLGQLLATSKPDEARKLLEPLRTSTRTAVSRAAINAAGSIAGGAAGAAPAKP